MPSFSVIANKGGFGLQKDKKPNTPSALTPAAKLEHAFIAESLIECIGPRLSPDVCMIN